MEQIVDAIIVTTPNLGAHTAQVYDALTGTTLHTYKGLQAASSTLAVTGPHRNVLCACKDRPQLQCWKLHKHEAVDARFTLPGRVTTLAVSPSPPSTLVAAIGEVLHVYSLESGSRLALVRRHFQPVTCVAFFPCGGYFVSAGEDGFLYVWSMAAVYRNSSEGKNAQNIQPYKQLGQHADKVTSVSVSGGSQGRLVSTSSDHTARVYDLYTMTLLHTIVWTNEITTAAISATATKLALANITGHIAIVDLYPYNAAQTMRVTDEMSTSCHEGAARFVSLLPSNSNTLVSAGEDGHVKLWAIEKCSNTTASVAGSSDAAHHNTNAGSAAAGNMRLALQRTIHRNRGSVTNMLIIRVDRKELSGEWDDGSNGQEFQSFSGVSCLDAPVTVTSTLRASTMFPDAQQHMDKWSAQHCSDQSKALQFLLQ